MLELYMAVITVLLGFALAWLDLFGVNLQPWTWFLIWATAVTGLPFLAILVIPPIVLIAGAISTKRATGHF